MNSSRHFQSSRAGRGVPANQKTVPVTGRGHMRSRSNTSSQVQPRTNSNTVKKDHMEGEHAISVNISSIYSDVVDIISANTKCDQKTAEKTFSDIAQLVNASVACQVNDALTAEIVSKLFHVKVDPAKNLLSSLSFALTTILYGNEESTELGDGVPEANGEGELVAEGENGMGVKIGVAERESNEYERAKNIEELVSLMDQNWDEILDRIANSGEYFLTLCDLY